MHVLAEKTACRRGGWQQRSLACSCSHAAVKQEESILIRSAIFHRGLPLLAQNGKTSCAPARAEAPAACARLISKLLPAIDTGLLLCHDIPPPRPAMRRSSPLFAEEHVPCSSRVGGRSLVRGGWGPAEALPLLARDEAIPCPPACVEAPGADAQDYQSCCCCPVCPAAQTGHTSPQGWL